MFYLIRDEDGDDEDAVGSFQDAMRRAKERANLTGRVYEVSEVHHLENVEPDYKDADE